MSNNEEFLDLYINEVTEAAHQEQIEDEHDKTSEYFECKTLYEDGMWS